MKLAINAVSMRPGGGLTVLVGLCEAWRPFADRMEVTVIANHESVPEALRPFSWVRCVKPRETRGSVLKQYLWQNHRLGRLLAELGSDLLVTNNHYLFNIPCLQVVHHQNAWRFLRRGEEPKRQGSTANWMRDWTARRALHSADANIFASEYLRSQAECIVPQSRPRNYMIRNALPDAVVEAALRLPIDHVTPPQLLVVQSANIHKDNPTAFRTLQELVRRAPEIPWRMKFAGSDGRGSRENLKDLAEDLGIADRVEWCGFLNQSQLDTLLKESLCLLCTSILEAGPLPVIEALARCCVPVAARIPAVEEFLGPAALLITPHQEQEFADAILRLYQEPDLRLQLRRAGQARVQDFRWSDSAAAMFHLFERLVADDPRKLPRAAVHA